MTLSIKRKIINFTLSMLSIFLILFSFSYAELHVKDSEILKKQFSPSGSIEALIDDYDSTYYLVQLDLKNDSLYNIANNILVSIAVIFRKKVRLIDNFYFSFD